MKMYHSNGKEEVPINAVILILVSIFPAIGTFVAVIGVCFLHASIIEKASLFISIVRFLIIEGIGCILLILGWSYIAVVFAKYAFDSTGMYVKYPLRLVKVIPWSDFQQICVCYANYATRGEPRANPIICCVKNGEKPNIYGRWKTGNPLRYRSVIYFDYSEEMYDIIQEHCPYRIVDLRQSRIYRI